MMKIKANYVIYDYRDKPKSYRLQVTHCGSGSVADVLFELEFVVLVSRICEKSNCGRREIANLYAIRTEEQVLFRRVNFDILDDK